MLLMLWTGRTFARRPASGWSRAEVYMLGHEELQSAAVRFLGDARLSEYRQRLHDWADGYQRGRWPAQTPSCCGSIPTCCGR